MSDCTDLIGIRVVVYLETDIDEISEIVERVFDIDLENSIDKRLSENPKEFGYRSLHLVCRMGPDRRKLPEYELIWEHRFEIQIRTALQDTWAEIEHRFNYKSEKALPNELQRKLFASSALLGSVDETLADITTSANAYFDDVSDKAESSFDDELTDISIQALVEKHAKRMGVFDRFKGIEHIQQDGSA